MGFLMPGKRETMNTAAAAMHKPLYKRPPRRPMTEAEKILARWQIGERAGLTEADYVKAWGMLAAQP